MRMYINIYVCVYIGIAGGAAGCVEPLSGDVKPSSGDIGHMHIYIHVQIHTIYTHMCVCVYVSRVVLLDAHDA